MPTLSQSTTIQVLLKLTRKTELNLCFQRRLCQRTRVRYFSKKRAFGDFFTEAFFFFRQKQKGFRTLRSAFFVTFRHRKVTKRCRSRKKLSDVFCEPRGLATPRATKVDSIKLLSKSPLFRSSLRSSYIRRATNKRT